MKLYTSDELERKIKRKNKIKRFFSIIIHIFVLIILISNIILLIQEIQNPNKMSSLFGLKAFNVISGSMEPTLQIGDIVIVKKAEQNEIQNGDIISFEEDGAIITHRVVDIIENDGTKYYETKGDNNNSKDSQKVQYEQIEGKYVFKISAIGKILIKLQNNKMILIVLIILCVIYLFFNNKEDRKIYRHKKRMEYERKENKKQ